MAWFVIALVVIAALLLWKSLARAADMPKAGDAAPGFALQDQDGRTRTLAEFRGRWLALYFFPRADTPG